MEDPVAHKEEHTNKYTKKERVRHSIHHYNINNNYFGGEKPQHASLTYRYAFVPTI
ncbi:hypothetical protein QGM71_11585 [Virgibacillus sp. C22-A2]|uniref:Uncharacterized protein n=1 Tax=Virgibacillus tibetensis TaxID=3042313 RepID=A0ABU6KGZ3_9BACI|nr:hypothetical protein [Virgibacillus sp. C22-A2]